MSSTVLRSFNLVGIDIAAILLDSPDKTRSLDALCTSDELPCVVKNTEEAQCAGFLLRVRALLSKTTGTHLPDRLWDNRAFANT